MLSAIEIENFKAFGERQRIELRPITLLFGPNSGGKSSVSHALHYLREVICEGNLDAHRTWSGGDVLDLGGIRNFVHARQVGRPIRLAAEFSLMGLELPDYWPFAGEELPDDFERVRDQVQNARVAIEIDTDDPPMLRALTVSINGEHLAEFWMPKERPHAEIRQINWMHPIFMLDPSQREAIAKMRTALGDGTADATRTGTEGGEAGSSGPNHNPDISEILGTLAIRFAEMGREPAPDAAITIPHPHGPLPDFGSRVSIVNRPEEDLKKVWEFESLLSMLLLGPATALAGHLRDFRHVGPLRKMPTRHAEPKEGLGRSRWSTGLQAWELLAHGHDMVAAPFEGSGALIDQVSRWLEAEDRLDTGYRLERLQFKQVPSVVAAMVSSAEFVDRVEYLADTIRSLPEHSRIVLRDVGRNLLLEPQDVGVGLSQIVPVIVALLTPGGFLVALEQPELHLHPRQQAALGDALIKGIGATPRRVLLVETHSEHLILRLLRRIRETTRKQVVAGQSLTPDQLRIQYVRREGSVSRAQAIDVDVNGDLVDPWPDDFFEQDFKERFT